MNNFSSWILSIVGIIIVGLLVEILLPKGSVRKLIKSIIAICSMFIIVKPLNNFNIKNINFSEVISSNIVINDNFVEERNKEKTKKIEESIEENLSLSGYNNIKISILYEYIEKKYNINTIYVDLRDLVLSDKNLNINKYTNIVAIIKKITAIKEESIVFYEWRKKDRKWIARR